MDTSHINRILNQIGYPHPAVAHSPFCAEEDGATYCVWKIETDHGYVVLKKATVLEKNTYESFFPNGGGPVPRVYGFHDDYILMEYVEGHTLSHCTREDLILALDSLIETQKQYWNREDLAHVGYGFEKCFPNREKRLPYMEDLGDCYKAYLAEFSSVPRSLCNDDLLPFNVIISGSRAVFLDWEFGGILPYPCALARLIAYGEENDHALFYMKREDQVFAVEYYYEHLICEKGIPYDAYIRTMKLFFFKEYSEWIYCANESGDLSGEYYKKYSVMARKLAAELGYI